LAPEMRIPGIKKLLFYSSICLSGVWGKLTGREPAGTVEILKFFIASLQRAFERNTLEPDVTPGRDGFNLVAMGDVKLHWPARHALSAVKQGFFEQTNKHCPHNYFNLYTPEPGSVVFDVGACEGIFTWLIKDRVSEIYAFEPIRDIAEGLRRTFAPEIASGRVIVVENGIHDRQQKMHFNFTGSNISGSSLECGLNAGAGSEAVNVTTIDDFVERHQIKRLDLVKMDIEGAELGALHGARRTIKALRSSFLVCVYHKDQDLFEIPAFFEREGYRVKSGPVSSILFTRLPGHKVSRPHFRPMIILATPQ